MNPRCWGTSPHPAGPAPPCAPQGLTKLLTLLFLQWQRESGPLTPLFCKMDVKVILIISIYI